MDPAILSLIEALAPVLESIVASTINTAMTHATAAAAAIPASNSVASTAVSVTTVANELSPVFEKIVSGLVSSVLQSHRGWRSKMSALARWALARLGEPSTYAGIAILAGSISHGISTHDWSQTIAVVSGALAIIAPER